MWLLKYATPLVPSASTNAIVRPCDPPIALAGQQDQAGQQRQEHRSLDAVELPMHGCTSSTALLSYCSRKRLADAATFPESCDQSDRLIGDERV